MARNRSAFGRIVVAVVLFFALFGAYTLYMSHEKTVDSAGAKVGKKFSDVHKALRK
jgi:hypothetical protein